MGTVNLDYRSLFLHFENGVWMCEAPCIQDIRKDFEATLKAPNGRTLSLNDSQQIPTDGGFWERVPVQSPLHQRREDPQNAAVELEEDVQVLAALCNAAKSGVDVRIITPHIPDKRWRCPSSGRTAPSR